MKRLSIFFLQAVIVLIGAGIFSWLIWFPQTEGRNALATDRIGIYFHDPFLAYVYIGSIPFFFALFQAYTLLKRMGRGREFFSRASVEALQKIKYCALAIIGFIIGAEAFIIFFVVEDDKAGGIAMGLFIAFFSLIIAATSGIFERVLQNVVTKK